MQHHLTFILDLVNVNFSQLMLYQLFLLHFIISVIVKVSCWRLHLTQIFLAENWPVYIIIIISIEKNFLTQLSDIMSCQISDFFVVLSYRWDCHQSVPSMYRNEHTNCGHLFRTRHDAHASSEGRRVLPDWERLAASGCLSQYSRDHSGRKGSQTH